MKTEIKRAKPEDFKEIAQIYSEEFSKPPYNEPWTQEKAIQKIKLFSKYCEIWIVMQDKVLVGFIVINTNWFCPGEFVFGEELAIKSEFQNQGIGTEAINFILGEYKKRGFKKLLGIENRNSRAKNLYDRLGIQESKENIIIEKELK